MGRRIFYAHSPPVKFLEEIFKENDEKCGEILAKFSVDFRPPISREIGHKKFHTNSSTHQDVKFHTAEPKFFHSDTLGAGGPKIFSRILSPDFSPHFCGEKVTRKILQENPWQNPPNFIQQKKFPDTFSAEGPGQEFNLYLLPFGRCFQFESFDLRPGPRVASCDPLEGKPWPLRAMPMAFMRSWVTSLDQASLMRVQT